MQLSSYIRRVKGDLISTEISGANLYWKYDDY